MHGAESVQCKMATVGVERLTCSVLLFFFFDAIVTFHKRFTVVIIMYSS